MRLALCVTLIAFLLLGCQSQDSKPVPKASAKRDAGAVAERAEDVQPVKTGDHAPGGELRTVDGERVQLAAVYANRPTMLIFYRGGW